MPRESTSRSPRSGVGKGSTKMPEEEVRKIEIAYPQAFCRAAKAGRRSCVRGHDSSGRGPPRPG